MGKSTLFNRLTKTRQAIVNEQAGTTRDRQYGKSEWLGKEFSVVDTGGWVVNSDDVFEEEIRKQVVLAIDEADVVLFVVDVMNGVTDLDMEVAGILRRSKTPVILVANKTDNIDLQYNAAEFYTLGLGDPYCISAMSGSGTGDLLDLVVSKFRKETDEILDEDIPRFAVVGRPNAGKSSIVNAFIGEERNIVTDIAGTTRDSIYTRYDKFGFDFYLVDTAGIRKKNKVSEDLEYYSVVRSIRSIENSDVCNGDDILFFFLICHHLYEHKLTADRIFVIKDDNPAHLFQLLDLIADLLQDLVVSADSYRDPRILRAVGHAGGKTVNIVTSAAEQGCHSREDTRIVVNKQGKNDLFHNNSTLLFYLCKKSCCAGFFARSRLRSTLCLPQYIFVRGLSPLICGNTLCLLRIIAVDKVIITNTVLVGDSRVFSCSEDKVL